jgi:hypothetical protein
MPRAEPRPREQPASPLNQRNALRDAILSARDAGATGTSPADVLRTRFRGKEAKAETKEAPLPTRERAAVPASSRQAEISPDDLRKILNGN